jgi:hypothetical protein
VQSTVDVPPNADEFPADKNFLGINDFLPDEANKLNPLDREWLEARLRGEPEDD